MGQDEIWQEKMGQNTAYKIRLGRIRGDKMGHDEERNHEAI
jgi:hypothetical protein